MKRLRFVIGTLRRLCRSKILRHLLTTPTSALRTFLGVAFAVVALLAPTLAPPPP